MTAPHFIDPARFLSEQLEQASPDLMRQMLTTFINALMSAEAEAVCGAEYGQISADRVNSRNGYRHRDFDTRTGTLDVAIPKLRTGTYFPDWLLERRRRAEAALTSVVATCYLLGVSTRRMEKLVESLGITRLSKSQVSIMAKDLDEQVEQFRTRPLDAGPYTFVAADALVLKVREGGRVANVHALLATGVNKDGHREILGLQVTSAEDGAGWLGFFRDLTARGLTGVKLVTSDAHAGLVAAIGATLPGATWQRCRTHYAANLMSATPKSSWPWVKTLLHSVYDQPDADAVHAQFDRVLNALEEKLPAVATHLEGARADVLAFTGFPKEIWRQLWSNNPLSVNRLSNDTSLSTLPMTRVPRSLGWKLVEIDGQGSSGYDRFSEEARRHVSHRGRLGRRRIGECLSRSPRCSGVQPEHGSLLRVRYRQLRTVSVGEGQHPCRGLADDGLRVDRLARRSFTRHI